MPIGEKKGQPKPGTIVFAIANTFEQNSVIEHITKFVDRLISIYRTKWE